MKTLFIRVFSWIDALCLRDRALLFFLALGLLAGGWQVGMSKTVEAKRVVLLGEVAGLQKQVAALNAAITTSIAARMADPDQENRERYRELKKELQNLEADLREMTDLLVPPRYMARALRDLLNPNPDTTLVSLHGTGVRALDVSAGPEGLAVEPADPPEAAIFEHGLQVKINAGYLDTLEYLQSLEALPWRFLWDSVDLEVDDYPNSSVTITVHSLSLETDWIGV